MTARVASASWPAIGTHVEVLVSDGDVDAARGAVEGVIDAADRTYSRFRPDSELSRIVASGGRETVVSALLARALDAAARGAALSAGVVDPTVGRALRLAGYDADFQLIADRHEPIVLRVEAAPGWRSVAWDPGSRRLRVPAGVELDLGSTGKALVADLAAAAAFETVATGPGTGEPGVGVLVSVGGDLATAGSPPPDGWRVLVTDDSGTAPDAGGEVVAIRDGALATSSTTVRRWRRGEVRLHHLIDPRTGRPAESRWRTASVTAGTCVDANIAATAAIVLGDVALDWLGRSGLAARLVAVDGEIVRVGGWPAPDTNHATA